MFVYIDLGQGADTIIDFSSAEFEEINLIGLFVANNFGGQTFVALVTNGNLARETGYYATDPATNDAAILDTQVYVDLDGSECFLVAPVEDAQLGSGDFFA